MVPKALPHQKHKRSDTSLSQWSHSHTVFLLPSTSFSLLFRDADFICFSAASSRSLLWWVTFPASRCSCLLPYTEWSQLFSQQLKSFWNTLSKGCFQCYHSLLPKGNFQSRGNHLNILPLRFLLPAHQPHTTLLTRSVTPGKYARLLSSCSLKSSLKSAQWTTSGTSTSLQHSGCSCHLNLPLVSPPTQGGSEWLLWLPVVNST